MLGDEFDEEQPLPPPIITGIQTYKNCIWFYDGVNERTTAMLMKTLKELEETYKEIILYLNSNGGGVFDAFGVIGFMQTLSSDVTTVCNGYTASAATLILMAGKKRLIMPYSIVLMHPFVYGFWGSPEDQKHDLRRVEITQANLRQFIIDTVNKPVPDDVLDNWAKRECWMSADEAIQYGLVDEFYTPRLVRTKSD